MAKFRARARTVDMLGRQQIANVSTAISELFKNAHDAYADQAEVDYFQSDNLLIIRDNGVGMTPTEFEERWLVLGTESKLATKGQAQTTYRPTNKAERAIMGEKGIGRLAIALLGRQVLVLTRAIRPKKEHDLVMCFIHWDLFEISGVNLDEIDIPLRTIPGGRLPTASEVEALVQEMSQTVEILAQEHELGGAVFQRILKDIDEFQLDPEDLDDFLDGLSLKNQKSGTHFFVSPADDGIAQEIEREKQLGTKDFRKFLLGFSNSTFREHSPPPIETSFRHWKTDSSDDELIGGGEFFTREEVDSADHKITGKIDAYGQFLGTVRIYGQTIDNHVVPWKEGAGQHTNCGPFEVEFGYVSGQQRETQLPPDDWKRITEKLNHIGGVYVYRDRIRVLPYGNSDFDWLKIEERRTKSASYYFFSHRRIFGAVMLTREHNGRLKEKAGREGFQQDKAYRQLKDILENLFLQLAADFFRTSGNFSDYYNEQRTELERLELARRRREKHVNVKRKDIAASLESFFVRLENDTPAKELAELRATINLSMATASTMWDPDEASAALLDIEKEAKNSLFAIRESYRLVKPRGVGLSRNLQRDWTAYSAELENLEKNVFDPFVDEVSRTLGAIAQEAQLYVDQRKRLSRLLEQQAETTRGMLNQEAKQLRDAAKETQLGAVKYARDAIREMQETIASVEVEFAQRDLTDLKPIEVEGIRYELEKRIESIGRKNCEALTKIRDALTTVSSNIQQGIEVAESDIVEAMDQELQELREQSDVDAEMVQLGLAIAVINHEFEAAIKGVRRSLRELRPWAKANPELSSLYQELRNNFDHLDGHLNLFTPLQRRLYRSAVPIKGSDINHYVHTLFDVRLKRHSINLESTETFLSTEIECFPSTLYPVFVNIIDNAIFWLNDIRGEKKITLDASSGGFLISNNGPAINTRDVEAIFEQGFTRKPGGRGLGLFISRRALRKDGMDIKLLPSTGKSGVTISIEGPKNDKTS